MAKYAPAQQVEQIAKGLIDEHHTHLKGVPIRYIFRETARKRNGDPVPGSTKKIAGLNAFLTRSGDSSPADPTEPRSYFVVEIAQDLWLDDLTDAQREALVDHHLARCGVDWTEDGEPRLFVEDPDVMEFRGVLSRQGAWNDRLAGFAREASQLALDLAEAAERGDLAPVDDDEDDGEEPF